ncbi:MULTISPECIES: MBL fold metallo-hydrolase [unclassified Streptomyces]|uniref:MBL fold metallo-hydrolase n=1 Tax=unclassified Streptomyces TaxID=2593676 RepID=UPI002E29D260|nr:MBL fold metallo-hydrolase [Streptomyces sp. NBC_00223]
MTVAEHVARLEGVADGIFAWIQPDGGWCLNNAGVIAGAGPVLIDTAATEARARALRAATIEMCGEPPRVVINTHAHGDHTFGNFVFPEAMVVGHAGTRAEVLQFGLHLTGLWPEVDWGNITLAPPTTTFQERLTLHIGGARVELLQLGPGHTTSDTVVWLPDAGVVFTGDVVMSGVTPFCPMGSVAGSLRVVDELRALGATTVVTGHGPVSGPEVYDTAEEYLRWLQRLARDGLAHGRTPLEAARATDNPYTHLLDPERLVPNLHRAYLEEIGAPAGTPVDMTALFAEMVEFRGSHPRCDA